MPRAATTVAEAVSVLINSIDSGTSMSDGEDDPSDRVIVFNQQGTPWQQVSVFFGEACSDVVDGLGMRFTSDAPFRMPRSRGVPIRRCPWNGSRASLTGTAGERPANSGESWKSRDEC